MMELIRQEPKTCEIHAGIKSVGPDYLTQAFKFAREADACRAAAL
jgi:GH35 family endo-1,4-beta-xylanase